MSSTARSTPYPVSTGRIVGGILVFLGLSPAASGMHHLVATGTCSSTGYDSTYGAVPYCPAGTGSYVGMLMVGCALVVVGGVLLVGGGCAPAPLFVALGLGSLSVGVGPWSVNGEERTFSIVFGGSFLVAGLVWLGIAAYVVLGRRAHATGGGTMLQSTWLPEPPTVEDEPDADPAAPTYQQPPTGPVPGLPTAGTD